MSRRAKQILAIVATDSTFERGELPDGTAVWSGKCIHCNTRIVVTALGEPLGPVTIEHIVPRVHGGTDAPENLALACARCNFQKGFRHDVKRKGDARAQEVIAFLSARRRARWRPAP
jgi:5-methylcytosine-specific restriction endonuclease McrA